MHLIDRMRSMRKVKYASSKVEPKKTKTKNTNFASFGAASLFALS